jgi:hypothetical protein
VQISLQAPSGAISDNGDTLKIGYDSVFGGQFLNGSIDDVRIYNRALAAQEVQQLFLMGH